VREKRTKRRRKEQVDWTLEGLGWTGLDWTEHCMVKSKGWMWHLPYIQ
jgi:glutamyl/glutaminyl-tRNA synthetase